MSNYRRIKNKKNNHILKPHADKDGYHTINLYPKNGLKVHRLLCEAVYGAPVGIKNEVNHKDGNRQNNHIKNLEWCARAENIKWSMEHGNMDYERVTSLMREKRRKPVRIIETGEIFESASECAEKLGIRTNRLTRYLARKNRSTMVGYYLEYAEKEDM